MHTQTFERVYMRTLRQIYDAEKQLCVSMPALCSPALGNLAEVLTEIEGQSKRQIARLEGIFQVLYEEPRGEASWVTTALLREAWDAIGNNGERASLQGCAAALLALKRYELTLYETLLRWSERCELEEALPAIRRSIAEELLQASILSGIAFEPNPDVSTMIPESERRALH